MEIQGAKKLYIKDNNYKHIFNNEKSEKQIYQNSKILLSNNPLFNHYLFLPNYLLYNITQVQQSSFSQGQASDPINFSSFLTP